MSLGPRCGWVLAALIVLLSRSAALPNILLLLTDDQDVVLRGTQYMPRLRRFLGEQGTTFRNFFVHTPICCPSRGSILTGRYIHNIPMINNSIEGNCYGEDWRNNAELETFAVYAKNAGYKTAFAGKYLNTYGEAQPKATSGCITGKESACRRVPLGWDRWMGLAGNSVYYNYKLVVRDGPTGITRVENHGRSYSQDYLPDVIARRTIRTIRQFSQLQSPFLVVGSWPTPHGPYTPAPQDKGTFDGFRAPRTPNWNATKQHNNQKHWLVRQQTAITDRLARNMDKIYSERQEALRTIDRHVELFVNELRQLGELNNTIIIYTSDNGFHFGQHRLASDKRHLYEHDIRVPMLVRGPGVPKNVIRDEIVLNIDIAPTIVALATQSNETPSNMDGLNFMSLFASPLGSNNSITSWRSDFLVSYNGEGNPVTGLRISVLNPRLGPNDSLNNTYNCVRTLYRKSLSNSSNETNSSSLVSTVNVSTANTMYCKFDDDENFVEFYDLSRDPWQLNNSARLLSPDEHLACTTRLETLKACEGSSCRDL